MIHEVKGDAKDKKVSATIHYLKCNYEYMYEALDLSLKKEK